MRQVTVTADSGGTSEPVILDQYQNPFSVTYSHSGSGIVQVSQTDPYPVENQDFTTASFVWTSAPTDYPNAAGFLGQPYRAIRIWDGDASETLTVIQSGVKG